jgi:hypothetical protein
MAHFAVVRVSYYYLCCWVTFCTIASINIFFRCPDWETALSFVHAIFGHGLEPYMRFFGNADRLDWKLFEAFSWVWLVFIAHEAQRYLDLRRRILGHWGIWSGVCLFFFWWIVNFGISGPEFIYYQF